MAGPVHMEPVVIRDFEKAFTEASGLPLELEAGNDRPHLRTCHNPFCKLMARINPACEECLRTQAKLKKLAQAGPKTVKCFAGLCETAVPVTVNGDSSAYLHTGHVFLSAPKAADFKKVASHLRERGVELNWKRAEKAWLSGRVMPPKKYQAFVKLVEAFTLHLKTCDAGATPQIADSNGLSQLMEKVTAYIHANSSKELPLRDVARLANLSPNHFCRRFKAATGLSFTEFLAHNRLESVKQMLRTDPAARISEVAYACGFQSISRFNRVFRQQTGKSPREYRDSIMHP